MVDFRKTFALIFFILVSLSINAQVKILFDATKAETAGNADWQIDADLFNLGYTEGPPVAGTGNESNPQRYPNPAQSTVTQSTTENYWKGGLSSWGIDLVKQGYWVETLPYNGQITFGNSGNAQDLSNYKVFVVCEPNILLTASEKTALMQFVQNGGGLFMISDHTSSDRNNDGYDSPDIWNDFMSNNGILSNPFGFTFDYANFSQTTYNIPNLPADPLLHGAMGNVTQAMWSAGTSMTLSPSANSTVVGVVYKNGSSFGNSNVMVCHATYGSGKVVGFGDSSPADDGTGDPNDQLYDGWLGDASGNHRTLIMNATIWLASSTSPAPTVTTLAASNITSSAATLNGSVNPNGSSTTYHFEWGTTTSYGNNTTSVSAGAGSSLVNVNANISGLIAGTTYHYRLVAQNSSGSTNGNDMTFTTSVATVTTTAATSVTMNSAVSGGNVTSDGGLTITARGVCWGTGSNPNISGNHTTDGTGTGSFISQLTGLNPNTLYHIRAYATNSSGTYYGSDLQFTTLSPVLTVTPPNQNVSATAGNTTFNVTSNSDWTVVSNAAWCTVTPSGSGNGIITATYTANTSASSRIATIQVTVAGLSPVSVTVTQSGNASQLLVTPANQNVGDDEGSTSFEVTSNSNWNVTCNAAWCSVTASGSGNGTITAEYSSNTSVIQRVAIIQVSAAGLPTVTVTVTQTGAEIQLFVTPAQQTVYKESGSVNYTVYSNTAWSCTSNSNWCSVTPSGIGNGTIEVIYAQNTTGTERTAQITVTAGNESQIVLLVQKPIIDAVNNSPENKLLVFPNPTTGLFKLKFTAGFEPNSEVKIINSSGQMVGLYKCDSAAELQIDLSNQPKGLYLVRLISGEKVFVQKVALQ